MKFALISILLGNNMSLYFEQYPGWFKEEIRLYAEVLGQRSTARLFSISQKRIFDWITESKCIPASSSQKRAAVLQSRKKSLSKIRKSLPYYSGGPAEYQAQLRKPTTKELDEKIESEIHQWILTQQPRKVSSSEVRAKAREVFEKNGREKVGCSYGWYRRFMTRIRKRSNSQIPKITQGLHESEDSLILAWLLTKYDNNQLVSYKELQSYAQHALRDIRPEFKASAGWALRFLKRNHLIINIDRVYSKDIPGLEPQVNCFTREVIEAMKQFPRESIGCMDEIPVTFHCPKVKAQVEANFEEESTPEDISLLRKISVSNCDATVVLTMIADGSLLPPMVIVKAQLSSSMNQIFISDANPVVTFYGESTAPTLSCLEKWVELVWSKNTQSSNSFLILDSFELHSSLVAKSTGITYKLIPPGCSVKLQPLNVSARNIFMKNMERLWTEFLSLNSTTEGAMKIPSTTEIVEWVHKSYEITKSHKADLAKSFHQLYQP